LRPVIEDITNVVQVALDKAQRDLAFIPGAAAVAPPAAYG
jgi:hypothetical protein